MRLMALAAIAALAGCATLPPPAQPVAELKQDDVTVSLYSEPCALAAVKNLPYRAQWREAGGSFEGCYTVQHQTIVVLYFDDRMVITAPLRVFGPHAPPQPIKPQPISL